MGDEWWCINGHRNNSHRAECETCSTTMRGKPRDFTPPDQRDRLSARERGRIRARIKDEEKRDRTAAQLASGTSTQPRCPTCQSSNVKPLGLASRGVSGALGGLLFSRRARAHFTCKSCGYNW